MPMMAGAASKGRAASRHCGATIMQAPRQLLEA
jgi:hypothetical protein